MWARLEKNVVQEIISFDPTDVFPEEIVWVKIPKVYLEFVAAGYTVDEEGEFSPPSPAYFIDQLSVQLSNWRYGEQIKPYKHTDGFEYYTDRESRADMSQKIQVLERKPENDRITPWKTVSGAYTTLTLDDLVDIGIAIDDYVTGQYSKEGQYLAELNKLISDKEDADTVIRTFYTRTGIDNPENVKENEAPPTPEETPVEAVEETPPPATSFTGEATPEGSSEVQNPGAPILPPSDAPVEAVPSDQEPAEPAEPAELMTPEDEKVTEETPSPTEEAPIDPAPEEAPVEEEPTEK